MITTVVMQGFRRFRQAEVALRPGMNVVVGDNEAGKSSLLEAVVAGLTGRVRAVGRRDYLPLAVLNHGLIDEWLGNVRSENGDAPPFPEAFIELYFADDVVSADYQGTNNSKREDCRGVRLEIKFENLNPADLPGILEDVRAGGPFPIEYYTTEWIAFSGQTLHPRASPLGSHLIDATRIRLDSGSDYFIKTVVDTALGDQQQRSLAATFRRMKGDLADTGGVAQVNDALAAAAASVTTKTLSLLAADSSSLAWTDAVQPHLDALPFASAGMGESSRLKILLALGRKVDTSDIFLVEEPENHLSFSSLNTLIDTITRTVPDKQVLLATHSSFVTNKLGLENVILLSGDRAVSLADLPDDTVRYFRRLSGYDTLRVLLCKGAFIVEGPSDDLVLQRFYLDAKGALPIRHGFDVIECRGLAFKRILDIAARVGRRVAVLTDNDGDYARRIGAFTSFADYEHIKVFTSEDASLPTLEPNIVASNDLAVLMNALGRTFADRDAAVDWMSKNKTEAAVRIFDADTPLEPPDYFRDALLWLVN